MKKKEKRKKKRTLERPRENASINEGRYIGKKKTMHSKRVK